MFYHHVVGLIFFCFLNAENAAKAHKSVKAAFVESNTVKITLKDSKVKSTQNSKEECIAFCMATKSCNGGVYLYDNRECHSMMYMRVHEDDVLKYRNVTTFALLDNDEVEMLADAKKDNCPMTAEDIFTKRSTKRVHWAKLPMDN
ncbi:hypothetical protein L596_012670 [Steinernema carpocapsae]|uniref:Apple domain-containing protein n=1 Tax=Steinernema carpocapsae TaxID=34508 RepID=A0A4U5NXT0_STECR|nr:hypothetical protein L596_012670 [Steinernema carpocapsae]